MTSDKRALLHQIFSRLCFHAGDVPDLHLQRRDRFIASLLAYPEDLICAAYHYVLKHTPHHTLPNEEDFIVFMMPEYRRRKHAECPEGV